MRSFPVVGLSRDIWVMLVTEFSQGCGSGGTAFEKRSQGFTTTGLLVCETLGPIQFPAPLQRMERTLREPNRRPISSHTGTDVGLEIIESHRKEDYKGTKE
jgi:hypothetical protein